MKTRTLILFALLAIMASCQKKEAAYKAQLNVKTEPYDLEFDRYEPAPGNVTEKVVRQAQLEKQEQ